MSLLAKRWVRDAVIYFLKAVAFAIGSYFLMVRIYGGVRISFIAWSVTVLLAFTAVYVPYLVRAIRQARREGKEGG